MLIKNTLLSVLALSFFTACHIERPQRKQAKNKDQLDTVWTEVFPLKRNLNILDTTVAHVGNSDSMMQKYNASLKQLDQVIHSIAKKVKHFENQPLYWVDLDKNGSCRVLLELNEIPLSYAYTKNAPEYRIDFLNPYITQTGNQNLRIRVYSPIRKEFSSDYYNIELRIGYAHDKRDGDGAPQYLTDTITLPKHVLDNGTQYWDTVINFHAEVPWDHSHRLNNATDLRTLPDLEEQVLRKYEELRQDFVNCDISGLFKASEAMLIYNCETLYMASKDKIRNEIERSLKSLMPNHPDKKVYPIYNYELTLYKNGKIALLRNAHDKSAVIRLTKYDADKYHEPYEYRWHVFLYLPEGESELQVY
jgi:hypothetical protein